MGPHASSLSAISFIALSRLGVDGKLMIFSIGGFSNRAWTCQQGPYLLWLASTRVIVNGVPLYASSAFSPELTKGGLLETFIFLFSFVAAQFRLQGGPVGG